MKHSAAEKIKKKNLQPFLFKRRALRILIVTIILLILIMGYLLWQNYQTQLRLQNTAVNRLEENLTGQARAVDYFILERENDLRELATGSMVTAYFTNKSLGMSEQYGLKGSLNNIQRQFKLLNASSLVNDQSIYARLVLFSSEGKVLAEYKDESPHPINQYDWQAIADTNKAGLLSSVMTDTLNPSFLLFTAPVRQQGELVGHIAGWVALSVIHKQFLSTTETSAGHNSGTTDIMIVSAGENGWFSSQKLDISLKRDLQNRLTERVWKRGRQFFISNDEGEENNIIASIVPLPGKEIKLIHLLERKHVSDPKGERRLLFILIFFSAAVIGLFFKAVRDSMKAQVLSARLIEAGRQQSKTRSINQKLIKEVDFRQKAEQQFAREKERLELVIHATDIGVWEWNVLTGDTIFNERWADILGYSLAELSPVSIQTWMDFCHPDDLKHSDDMLNKHFAGEVDFYDCECRMKHKDGHWVWVHDRGRVVEWTSDSKPLRMSGTHTDISDRKRAEDEIRIANEVLEQRVRERTNELEGLHSQMVMQEKMASVGQLAAGIAHELNNPINFVRTNFASLTENFIDIADVLTRYRELTADLESRYSDLPELTAIRTKESDLEIDYILEDIPALFTESQSGFKRIARIIKSMREFSYVNHTGSLTYFNINKGINDTLVIAGHVYKYHADVQKELGDFPEILCLPEQLNQVFLNLIVNSAQAIEAKQEKTRGLITIRTWQEKNYVCCEIADNGPGIPENIRSRVFEPFFTTKDPGKGTGLGLSISYDIIVHKHRGEMSVECPETGGSVFLIKLPAE